MFDISTNIDYIDEMLTDYKHADDHADSDNKNRRDDYNNGRNTNNGDDVVDDDDDDDDDDRNHLNLSDNEEFVKEKQKLILIETQHGIDDKVYLIYKILNSKDSNNFLIMQELESENSDEWNKERPVEIWVQTLSQVLESVAFQSKKKTHASHVKRDESLVNKKRKHEDIEKDKHRVRQGIKGGIIKTYKIDKGYGFVREDETGESIFFHTSRKIDNEWIPHVGERVEYTLQYDKTKKRETAVDVAMLYTKNKWPRSNFPVSQEAARKYANHSNNEDRHAQTYSTFFDMFEQRNHGNHAREDARTFDENCKLRCFPELSINIFV